MRIAEECEAAPELVGGMSTARGFEDLFNKNQSQLDKFMELSKQSCLTNKVSTYPIFKETICNIAQRISATDKPPFVGEKSFNFMGGSGTGQSITIKKNGETTIILHGTSDSAVLYKGKFSNPIVAKDGSGWLFKDNKIYQTTNGKVDTDCMGDGQPCESDLY